MATMLSGFVFVMGIIPMHVSRTCLCLFVMVVDDDDRDRGNEMIRDPN